MLSLAQSARRRGSGKTVSLYAGGGVNIMMQYKRGHQSAVPGNTDGLTAQYEQNHAVADKGVKHEAARRFKAHE